jgi:hypothetical protein
MGKMSVQYILALALVVASVGGPVSARAFDLQCDDERYRVDLKAKRWCDGRCTEARRLYYNRRGDITFYSMEHFALSYDLRANILKHWAGGIGDEGETHRTRCRIYRFSGFPTDPSSKSAK